MGEGSIQREQPAAPGMVSGLDRWGIIISGACVIHCLALPELAAMLPYLTTILPSEEWAHPVMLGLALPVTGTALLRGYLRHRLPRPALIGCTGLALIATALFAESILGETLLTVGGGLLVAAAHLANWRQHRCRSGE